MTAVTFNKRTRRLTILLLVLVVLPSVPTILNRMLFAPSYQSAPCPDWTEDKLKRSIAKSLSRHISLKDSTIHHGDVVARYWPLRDRPVWSARPVTRTEGQADQTWTVRIRCDGSTEAWAAH